eukprot:CAMPEP_0183416718 /NCGR_PEP_ID=MMETSP0370-20130417/23955_1 /TAXON_ID=268820 /ORGANISM="Peridinium aciculiferum, Strain PAER-2" /LENGTH=36 /DNA_ID= /DNA_START= /DNA_END= /DNA_ORIENTATION=
MKRSDLDKASMAPADRRELAPSAVGRVWARALVSRS